MKLQVTSHIWGTVTKGNAETCLTFLACASLFTCVPFKPMDEVPAFEVIQKEHNLTQQQSCSFWNPQKVALWVLQRRVGVFSTGSARTVTNGRKTKTKESSLTDVSLPPGVIGLSIHFLRRQSHIRSNKTLPPQGAQPFI